MIDNEEIKRRAANLENRYKTLRKSINSDPAKSASTMLHFYRRNLDELRFERHFLCEIGALEQYLSDYFADAFEKDMAQTLHDRMQQRIKWQAGLINETIETRKNKGSYKGEFTTAVILANAYNDIFHNHAAVELKFVEEYPLVDFGCGVCVFAEGVADE